MNKERLMVFRSIDNEDLNSVYNWNLIVADTNFPITKKVITIINGVDGVESLNILSPYKITIGIGELFNEEYVKENILEAVYASFENPVLVIPEEKPKKSQEEIIFNNLKSLNKDCKFFATIFTSGDNPQVKFIFENDETEANRKLEFILNENKEGKVLKTWN